MENSPPVVGLTPSGGGPYGPPSSAIDHSITSSRRGRDRDPVDARLVVGTDRQLVATEPRAESLGVSAHLDPRETGCAYTMPGSGAGVQLVGDVPGEEERHPGLARGRRARPSASDGLAEGVLVQSDLEPEPGCDRVEVVGDRGDREPAASSRRAFEHAPPNAVSAAAGSSTAATSSVPDHRAAIRFAVPSARAARLRSNSIRSSSRNRTAASSRSRTAYTTWSSRSMPPPYPNVVLDSAP